MTACSLVLLVFVPIYLHEHLKRQTVATPTASDMSHHVSSHRDLSSCSCTPEIRFTLSKRRKNSRYKKRTEILFFYFDLCINVMFCLVDHTLSILPVGRDTLRSFVIASDAMDSAFNKDKSEFRILVLTIAVQMFTHRHSLLDEHVQVLGQFRGKALRLENTQDLVTCHSFDLGNTLRVTKIHTDLRWHKTLLGQLADLIGDLFRGCLQP